MPVAPILTSLDATVTRATSVQASATALIRGFKDAQAAAIAKALANGATAAELEPLTALNAALDSSTADLSAAVIENTSAASEPPA